MRTSVLLATARGKEVDQVGPSALSRWRHETTQAQRSGHGRGKNDYEVFLGGHRVGPCDSARAGSELAVGDRLGGRVGSCRRQRAPGGARLRRCTSGEARGHRRRRPEPLRHEHGDRADRVELGLGGPRGPQVTPCGEDDLAVGPDTAWQVTINDSSAAHLWNAAVDARTGKLLESADWTSHDSMGDLASTLARSQSSVAAAASVPFPPNPVLDGSSYRVLQLPTESPNDAARQPPGQRHPPEAVLPEHGDPAVHIRQH
jgi:hypothetical protein